MDYQKVQVEVVGQVGKITLNAPPANPISKQMIWEMLDILDRFEREDQIRAVYLTHSGENFAVGAGDAEETLPPEEKVKSYSELGGKLVDRIDFFPKPTIVAAKGLCVGGGTPIFNVFDIRIAGGSFRIKDGDVYYGNVGSMGMTSLRLPIWLGRNKVMDYLFLQKITDEGWNAEDAYRLGLVSKVVPDDMLAVTGMHYAEKLATAAPIAARYYKECIHKAIYAHLQEARAFELQAAAIVSETEDAQNGLTAVTEGREPVFYGR